MRCEMQDFQHNVKTLLETLRGANPRILDMVCKARPLTQIDAAALGKVFPPDTNAAELAVALGYVFGIQLAALCMSLSPLGKCAEIREAILAQVNATVRKLAPDEDESPRVLQ